MIPSERGTCLPEAAARRVAAAFSLGNEEIEEAYARALAHGMWTLDAATLALAGVEDAL